LLEAASAQEEVDAISAGRHVAGFAMVPVMIGTNEWVAESTVMNSRPAFVP
jgi:hypothetical protein